MNIKLVATPTVGRESISRSCLQTNQMLKERCRRRGDKHIFPIPESRPNENYRQVTLPLKVTAFFLSPCQLDHVIPLESDERIYIIDDNDGFPPRLARSTIELREKNIWVVQSRSRASQQNRVSRYLGMKTDKCSCGTTRLLKVHDNLARNVLPNTRSEIRETFEANALTSPLCKLMASHPEQIQRFVREGCFYAGPNDYKGHCVRGNQEATGEDDIVICAFCHERTRFALSSIRLLAKGKDRPGGWETVESFLFSKSVHHPRCGFKKFYNDDALLEVSDLEGNIIPTQSYFIADPALERSGSADDMGKSCAYTRVFIRADISEQKRRRLIITHDQIHQVMRQHHLETLCTRTHEGTGTLTSALQDFEQMLQELPSRYQELYDESELNSAVSNYRSKLQWLPRPVTRLQQEVLDFLKDADVPLCTFYATSKQLTHILPLTRGANTLVLNLLTATISELVAQYQQAVHALYGQIEITNLASLVPYELWSNCALREIGEAGNEVLDYLNRLIIDDNELYQAFAAHPLKSVETMRTAGCV